MIPFRVIRSGVLLTGLVAALAAPLSAVAGGFTANLTPEQKSEAGLANHSPAELTALDRLVAADVRAHRTQAPALADRYSQRYTEGETKEAGLDRLTPEQLARLDQLINAALASMPHAQSQPRERPRLKDDAILTERGRLQVHGGMSLTMGWAEGGRNYRGVGAWVSYFDPVTGLGLSFSYSRNSGDLMGNYYGNNYYAGAPYLYTAPRTPYSILDRGSLDLDRNEYAADGTALGGPSLIGYPSRGFRR